jgi:hypothetical protein
MSKSTGFYLELENETRSKTTFALSRAVSLSHRRQVPSQSLRNFQSLQEETLSYFTF